LDRSREGSARPEPVVSARRGLAAALCGQSSRARCERIWALAKHESFVIVTKDNDFLARALVRGHPPQVVQICLGNASTRQIAHVLKARMDDIERFVAENKESVFLLRE
jgi:predicted nuclease of predicted toxin-antitoxin system